MPKRDYYDLLGVERAATPDQIKHAFRLKAVKLHPDQNPGTNAERQFAELREAYGVLCDEMRRAFYDRNGMNEVEFSKVRTEEALDDLFRRERAAAVPVRPTRARAAAGDILVTVSPLAARRSAEAPTLTYSRLVVCGDCAKAKEHRACEGCGGSGQRVLRRGLRSAQSKCTACWGLGQLPSRSCSTCQGSGRIARSTRIPLQPQPPGLLQRIEAAGDELPGNDPGDLYVLHVGPEAAELGPLDVECAATLGVATALLGGDVTVNAAGEPLVISVPAGATHGHTLRFEGRGRQLGDRRGALVVRLIGAPLPTSGAERALLEELRDLERGSRPGAVPPRVDAT